MNTSTTLPASNSPLHKIQILNAFSLKILAIILMIFDHVHQMFHWMGAPLWLTMLGRLVLPIFLFMTAEGYYYTRNKKKYLMRLLIGFWVMSIANFSLNEFFPVPDVMLINSAFGTMFLSVFYIWMIDILKQGIKAKNKSKILTSLGGMLLPVLSVLPVLLLINTSETMPRWVIFICLSVFPTALTVEGGPLMILLAVSFYLLRKNRLLQMVPLIVVSLIVAISGDMVQTLMVLAIIPLLMYNAEPGRKNKYFFYIFYPAHIYILYMLAYLVFRLTQS